MAITYSLTATIDTVATNVRNRGGYKSGAVPDARLFATINEGIEEAFAIIVDTDESRGFARDTSITTVAGTESYALPNDAWSVLGVSIAHASSPSGYKALGRIERSERNTVTMTSLASPTDAKYSIEGSRIYLWPIPPSAIGLLLEVAIYPPTLSTGDSWDGLGVPGWQRYVEAYALYQTAIEQDDPADGWRSRMEDAELRLRRRARRDRAAPRHLPGAVVARDPWDTWRY